MDWYAKYKSPLGYQTGENHIDSYGVDHSGFSTRDELEYQFARQNKENQKPTHPELQQSRHNPRLSASWHQLLGQFA